jgi:hypothetical protein
LALDEIAENERWTDRKIAAAYGTHERTIGILRKRFVQEGFESALERKQREFPPVIKIDGEKEAKIIAVTCSAAPEGQSRWTLQLLAEKVVALGIMESISPTAIGNLLKKTTLSHGYKSNGASPRRQMSL